MAQKPARYAATDENLDNHALEPAMKWLIATALDGSKMTYGEVKHRLETEESFSTIFTTRIGRVAGELMSRIQEAAPKAPLINVLVVNQKDRQPSEGAYVDRAAAEVYAYAPHMWSRLYERVFDRGLGKGEIETEREKRQHGNEQDFGVGKYKYGAGGEGKHHKALRLWVAANPRMLGRSFAGARSETEVNLDSGDRVDAVYYLKDRTVVLEVKSRISNSVDLRRGVFQCIKYRAVKMAMDVRMGATVQAVLVNETKLPGEIAELVKQHDIVHFQALIKRD